MPTYVDEQVPAAVEPEWLMRSYSRSLGWIGVPSVNVDKYTLLQEEENYTPYTPPSSVPCPRSDKSTQIESPG